MALILIVLFLVLSVFLRVGIQWYRTNDFGLRAARLDAPLIEILPGIAFVLSFCVAFVVCFLGTFNRLTPLIELPILIRVFLFLIGLIGIAITVVSQNQMGDSWRIGVNKKETTDLKIHGLYARSRNPIYFGILLLWVGLCGTFIQPILILSAITCWVSIELIVRTTEEPYLQKVHGELFIKYVSRTNRYIPI